MFLYYYGCNLSRQWVKYSRGIECKRLWCLKILFQHIKITLRNASDQQLFLKVWLLWGFFYHLVHFSTGSISLMYMPKQAYIQYKNVKITMSEITIKDVHYERVSNYLSVVSSIFSVKDEQWESCCLMMSFKHSQMHFTLFV